MKPDPKTPGRRSQIPKPVSPQKIAKILNPGTPTPAQPPPSPTTSDNFAQNSTRALSAPDLSGFPITDDELIRARAELCKKSFKFFLDEFIDLVMTETFVDNWHVGYLCEVLQEIGMRVVRRGKKDKDLLCNLAPGSSKSTIFSILFPAWVWINDPKVTFITGSHQQDLANRQANASRQLMKSEKFQRYFPFIKFKSDQDNKSDYENTFGGYRLATSTGSSPTGRHALILVLDDPQNPDTAASEVERGNTNQWVGSTLSSRKSNKEVSIMLVVQQRLHSNDVTGFLLSTGKQFNHVCLPAQVNNAVSPAHLMERYEDGLLDPTRLTAKILEDAKLEMGSRAFSAQFLQKTSNEESSILRETWFPRISKPDFQQLLETSGAPTFFYLDTAYTNKQVNDPSAVLACVKINKDLYIREVATVRYEFPKLVKWISSWTSTHGYTKRSRIVIEPKASGLSIIQQLKAETGLNVIAGVPPKQDKLTRLNSISPIVEAGRVILVDGAWTPLFLAEVTSDEPLHDDQADCLTAAVTDLLVKGVYRPHRFSFL